MRSCMLHTDYYSNLFRLRGPKFREFLHLDYLICFNPVTLQKMPLNINRENGIFGYRNTQYKDYQRLNMSAQTNYYSPISIYGFKFNFYLLLQASLLASRKEFIFNSPFYTGFTLGCQIRNENLSFNTIRSQPAISPLCNRATRLVYGPNAFFVFITSVTAFNFPIFALDPADADTVQVIWKFEEFENLRIWNDLINAGFLRLKKERIGNSLNFFHSQILKFPNSQIIPPFPAADPYPICSV